MKVTINQIADLAGVSRGTVDKVLHDRPGVRPEVRQRVQEIIEQTGYIPLHPKRKPSIPAQKTAAVILPRQANPFFEDLKRGMDHTYEILRDAGLALEYYFFDNTNVEGILTILDNLKDRPIDAYLIRGVRSERLRQQLDAVSEQGIPVIFIDSDVPRAKRLCLIGEDCYKSGRIAASLVAKSIGFAGEVAIIGGFPEINAHQQRIKGFEDVMRERWPQIQIVEKLFTLDQSVITYEKSCMLLDRCPNLRGIFSIAGCAGDIGQAIIDRNCRDRVKMVCYNTTQDVIALIEKGIVQFSINLAPYQQGQLLVEVAGTLLLHGRLLPATYLRTPIEIKLDENIDMDSHAATK